MHIANHEIEIRSMYTDSINPEALCQLGAGALQPEEGSACGGRFCQIQVASC